MKQFTDARVRTPWRAGTPTQYTGADAHWAEWIAWVLEADGYRVKLQKWDFRPGTNFVLEMDVAATQAERTVAILSPAYFESPHGRAEWSAAFVDDPEGKTRKLVPVRVAACKPPGTLRVLVTNILRRKRRAATSRAFPSPRLTTDFRLRVDRAEPAHLGCHFGK